MAGGGDHGGDFREKVWTMTGGPNCRPRYWKRNTAIAMAGIVLICIPIAMKSAQLGKGHIIQSGLFPLSSGARILGQKNTNLSDRYS